jgi:hypothetical protein
MRLSRLRREAPSWRSLCLLDSSGIREGVRMDTEQLWWVLNEFQSHYADHSKKLQEAYRKCCELENELIEAEKEGLTPENTPRLAVQKYRLTRLEETAESRLRLESLVVGDFGLTPSQFAEKCQNLMDTLADFNNQYSRAPYPWPQHSSVLQLAFARPLRLSFSKEDSKEE